MKIEDHLKGFIVAHYGSLKNFSEHTEVPYQTLVSILRRGIKNASFGNIVKICNVLGINIDELSKDNIKSDPIAIVQGKKRDITTIIRQYTYFKNHEGTITLDDQPLNEEELATLNDSLIVIVDLLRLRRRKRNLGENKTDRIITKEIEE